MSIRLVKRWLRRLNRINQSAGGPSWNLGPPSASREALRRAIEPAAVSTLPSGDISEPDLLRLAASLAWSRPVATYPGWHFDKDWENPLPGYQLRRCLWSYFRSQNKQVPLLMPWTDGLRLQTHLSNDESKQLFIAGCVDPNEFAFLDRILSAGMTFIDVGANNGLYTLFAARRVGAAGTVWAFEPSHREAERLRTNLALNPFPTVRIFQAALSDVDGQAPMRIAEDEHAGQNTLGDFCYVVQLARQEMVAVRRLDNLSHDEKLPRVDVMKIDAEGAEVNVLSGALRLLRAHRPVLMVEVVDQALRGLGTSEARLLEFLDDQDYRVHVYDAATGEPRPARPGESGANVIALPIESRLAHTFRRAG